MAKKLAYEDRKIAFEKQVKLAIAKEFSAGNKALPLDGGFPHDYYGFLSEEDMAEILRKAAAGIDGTTDCAGDYLFHREPYLD